MQTHCGTASVWTSASLVVKMVEGQEHIVSKQPLQQQQQQQQRLLESRPRPAWRGIEFINRVMIHGNLLCVCTSEMLFFRASRQDPRLARSSSKREGGGHIV